MKIQSRILKKYRLKQRCEKAKKDGFVRIMRVSKLL